MIRVRNSTGCRLAVGNITRIAGVSSTLHASATDQASFTVVTKAYPDGRTTSGLSCLRPAYRLYSRELFAASTGVPDGQITARARVPVQSSAHKHFASVFRYFMISSPRPASPRGALRVVTNVEAGCGGRDGPSALFLRGRLRPSRTVKPCGPGTPTLVPSSRALRSSRATGARKPGPRGERGISRKAIAQGMPDDSAEPVVPSPCFFTARGPWVRPSPGIPCALCFWRDMIDAKLGRDNAPRDGWCVSERAPSLRAALAPKQSKVSPR